MKKYGPKNVFGSGKNKGRTHSKNNCQKKVGQATYQIELPDKNNYRNMDQSPNKAGQATYQPLVFEYSPEPVEKITSESNLLRNGGGKRKPK